jgi:hypothetical protein
VVLGSTGGVLELVGDVLVGEARRRGAVPRVPIGIAIDIGRNCERRVSPAAVRVGAPW